MSVTGSLINTSTSIIYLFIVKVTRVTVKVSQCQRGLGSSVCVLSSVSSSNKLGIPSLVNNFVYKTFVVYQCIFRHEIYNLQNWNNSPQLIIYYCNPVFQLEIVTLAMLSATVDFVRNTASYVSLRNVQV